MLLKKVANDILGWKIQSSHSLTRIQVECFSYIINHLCVTTCAVFFHPSFPALSSLTVRFSAPMGLIAVYFTRRETITPQWKEIHLTSFHLGSFVSLVHTAHSKAITLQFSTFQSAYVLYQIIAGLFGTMCMKEQPLLKINGALVLNEL